MIFGSETISPLGPTKDVCESVCVCVDSGLPARIDNEGRVEIEDDVDEEDHVDDAVDN